ncbi:phosphate acetyltransferase [Pelagibaculum spongiae]|uniref:Phosphate acetyltransferase n=1 Tax=Pelagibaculum spongiae TaxID=2080658 RepID=A0A2V1GPU8_9GAMM|nr:phosphate acetyltransferase [Pelagibaculum spongiae]PVZ64989.1 phosphate acetyltransferase [Pelagibaculum spongiae]
MPYTLFVAPVGAGTGLTSVSLGLLRAFDRLGLRVAFLKPVGQPGVPIEEADRSCHFVRSMMSLQPPEPISAERMETLMGQGKRNQLMEHIVELHAKVSKNADVVIVEGLVPVPGYSFSLRLNAEIASCLNAEMLLSTSFADKGVDSYFRQLEIAARVYRSVENDTIAGWTVNKLPKGFKADHNLADINEVNQFFQNKADETSDQGMKCLGVIPFTRSLVAPRPADVARLINAEIINAGDINNRRIKRTVIFARQVANQGQEMIAGTLLVTPGDREDVIMAACLAAFNGIPLAGILLTDGQRPSGTVLDLCQKAMATGLPVMAVDLELHDTVNRLEELENEVPKDDRERMDQVMEHMASHFDSEWLRQRCQMSHNARLSPPAFRYQLIEKARAANKRIVLPEGEDPRTLQAACIAQKRGIARCVLLGDPEKIHQIAKGHYIKLDPEIEIINPLDVLEEYVEPLFELRKHKGMTPDRAREYLHDEVVLGTMMLAKNGVDGLVSGAIHTTADTIRPALQLIKTAPECKAVSSVFFMLLPEQVLVYGDCAVNPDPDAETLADIAIQSANSAEIFGIEPRVAMISYSTGSSGGGSDVEKVREATRIARERRPDLLIDGPLQYDAAAIASVAKGKAPNSPVAGRATVFVFPDLNTGNTTYKAVQRSAHVVSVGPMLQGLNKPVNDLSRGAMVEDIVFTIALTAIQAIDK